MTTLDPTGFSSQWAYSDYWTRVYAPASAGAMHWPHPVHCVTQTDIAGCDVLFGNVGVDFKVHRKLWGPPDDPEVAVEDKLRFSVEQACWQAHCWPSALPGVVVLVGLPEAAQWLRRDHQALSRLRHVSSEGTVFWTPCYSLLEACLPYGKVQRLAVNVAVMSC
jgi:hypothetical protein